MSELSKSSNTVDLGKVMLIALAVSFVLVLKVIA